MKRRTLQLAAIWSVAVWPALNFTAHNWADVVAVGAGALTGTWLITLFLGSIGHALHYGASRRNAGGFVVAFYVVVICLFFGYSLTHDASAALFARINLVIPPTFGWVVVVIVGIVTVVVFRKNEGLHVAASVFSFTAMVLALGDLIFIASQSPKQQLEAPVMASSQQGHANSKSGGMNVYYILLDWYAGEAGLREFAGFDNSRFINAMIQRGFLDATNKDSPSVRSNYLITEQTLGAIFSLDYKITEDPRTWSEVWHLFPYVINGAQAPPLVQEFKFAGYSVWQTFNTWIGCSGRHMRCLGGQGSLDFDFMTTAFLAPTPLGRAVSLLLGRRVDGMSAIEMHLPAILHSEKPNFVFVHSVLTHPPFSLDAECRPRAEVGSDYRGSQIAREAYIEAVKCTNTRVIDLVDRISSGNPDAVIVVESDHGSAFTAEWEVPIDNWHESPIRERTSFLNLIKAPAACANWLNRPLGQVNTARFVLACAQGRPPEYLSQRSYLSTYAKGADKRVVLLTDQQSARRN